MGGIHFVNKVSHLNTTQVICNYEDNQDESLASDQKIKVFNCFGDFTDQQLNLY